MILLGCLLSSRALPQQIEQEWLNFTKAAHQIGFCVYNVNQAYCEDHQTEKELYQSTQEEENEYFVMHEQWAEKRVIDWAKKQNQPRESFLMIFDIRQGYTKSRSVEDKKPYRSFLVFNLSDSIKFQNFRVVDDHVAFCSIASNEESRMLENTQWREFMTGRLGRLTNMVTFSIVSESDVAKRYQTFLRGFEAFQNNFN